MGVSLSFALIATMSALLKALGDGVVPAVALATHAADDAGRIEPRDVVVGAVGAATVRVVDEPGWRVPEPQCPVQRRQGKSSVTFDAVSQPGHTTLDMDTPCRNVPAGLLASSPDSSSCLAITTTATYGSGVDVCIPLPAQHQDQVNALFQCDPNPANLPCPIAGIDQRLVTAHQDHDGRSWCCGDVRGPGPITDPMCVTTTGLSTFALGKALPAGGTGGVAVPALGRKELWLAGLLALVSLLLINRRKVLRA